MSRILVFMKANRRVVSCRAVVQSVSLTEPSFIGVWVARHTTSRLVRVAGSYVARSYKSYAPVNLYGSERLWSARQGATLVHHIPTLSPFYCTDAGRGNFTFCVSSPQTTLTVAVLLFGSTIGVSVCPTWVSAYLVGRCWGDCRVQGPIPYTARYKNNRPDLLAARAG